MLALPPGSPYLTLPFPRELVLSIDTFRPRSASELIDATVQLTRRNFGPMMVLAAMIAIPQMVLGLINARLVGNSLPPGVMPNMSVFSRVLPVLLLSSCWFFVGFGALVLAGSRAYLGERIDAPAALGEALRRTGRLIGAHLLVYLFFVLAATASILLMSGVIVAASAMGAPVVAGLFGVVAFFGIFIGMVAFAARYATLPAVIMIEQLGAYASIKRASALAAGSIWRIVGLLTVFFVIFFVFIAVAFGLAALVVRDQTLAGPIAGVLTLPIYAAVGIMIATLYFDLRIRKEGYDIELMERHLATSAGAPAMELPAH